MKGEAEAYAIEVKAKAEAEQVRTKKMAVKRNFAERERGGEGVTMPMMLLAIFTMATVMKAKMLLVKWMMTTEKPIRKGVHTII